MRDAYILGIIEMLDHCDDVSLLELLYSLLAQEVSA